MTRVHPFEHDDAVVVAESRVELAVAHVERDHTGRAALEQAVREPPVEAPRSRQSFPAGSTPRASSACASFSPPRETNRGGRSTASSTSSRPAGRLSNPGTSPRARVPEPGRGSPRAALHEHDVEALLVQGTDGRTSMATRGERVTRMRRARRGRIADVRTRAPRTPNRSSTRPRSRRTSSFRTGLSTGRAASRSRSTSPRSIRGLRARASECGLGLPSLVAARLGADVIATDWASDAIALLERNAARNGTKVTAATCDWREPNASSRSACSLVLAADVLYEERNAEPILALLEALDALPRSPTPDAATPSRSSTPPGTTAGGRRSRQADPVGRIHRLSRVRTS